MGHTSTLRLGSLSLASPFLLAPLESVSDAPFRRWCWSLGAGLTWTEMIRARALARGNRSTLELIDSWEADVPTGLQLMAVNESELRLALTTVEQLAASTHPHFGNLCAVDLNLGCPSPAVIQVGAGPALLKRRAKLRALFQTLADWKRATPLRIGAVGAKIRLGINRSEQDQRVYLPVVEVANDTLDYLTIHARHARQLSTDPPSWGAIAEAKAKATIPIIGNGDVFSRADAERLFAAGGCDGVMVARAAIRSPWVFRALTQRGPEDPTAAELDAAERRYFEEAERLGSKAKFLEWHREGFRRMRQRLSGAPTRGTGLPVAEPSG
jgi:tRNA-dihydrouridine synthase B